MFGREAPQPRSMTTNITAERGMVSCLPWIKNKPDQVSVAAAVGVGRQPAADRSQSRRLAGQAQGRQPGQLHLHCAAQPAAGAGHGPTGDPGWVPAALLLLSVHGLHPRMQSWATRHQLRVGTALRDHVLALALQWAQCSAA